MRNAEEDDRAITDRLAAEALRLGNDHEAFAQWVGTLNARERILLAAWIEQAIADIPPTFKRRGDDLG